MPSPPERQEWMVWRGNHPSLPLADPAYPNDPGTPRRLPGLSGFYLHPSPSPSHPLLRDDIKWKWHAFGRQEADKQEAQLSPSFVQPAVKYTQ